MHYELLIKKHKNKLVYTIITLSIIFFYRKVMQPYLFVNSYQRDSFTNIFDMGRNFKVFQWSVKIIFRDYFVAIFKSLNNLYKIKIFEWIISLLISLGVFKVLQSFDFNSHSERIKKVGIITFIGFIVSFGIFVFSTYKPSLYGFENRNLGAVRLFFTVSTLCFFIYIIRKGILKKNISIMIFSIFIFILIIANLGIKNSWIYANNFNNQIFKKIRLELIKNKIEEGTVCIGFDVYEELKTNPNFILREPLFFNEWESSELAFRNGIDEKKIKILNSARESKNCNYKINIKKDKITKK